MNLAIVLVGENMFIPIIYTIAARRVTALYQPVAASYAGPPCETGSLQNSPQVQTHVLNYFMLEGVRRVNLGSVIQVISKCL